MEPKKHTRIVLNVTVHGVFFHLSESVIKGYGISKLQNRGTGLSRSAGANDLIARSVVLKLRAATQLWAVMRFF